MSLSLFTDKKRSAIIFIVFLVVVGCVYDNSKKVEEASLVLTDDLGRTVKLSNPPKRFLSMAPSVTELLSMVCNDSQLVGRTPYCNYPLSILSKPIVQNYPPDLEKILYLHPDIVFTKEGMLSLEQANAIEKVGIPVYFQKYDSVETIFRKLEELSIITGQPDKGKSIADSLRIFVKQISSIPREEEVPRVLLLASQENYYVYGKNTYATDILRLAGATNALDSTFQEPYPMLTAEYILKLNPQILIGNEGFDFENGFFEIHPELKKLDAYKHKRYYTVKDDYISRPGPRVIEAIKRIKEIVKLSK